MAARSARANKRSCNHRERIMASTSDEFRAASASDEASLSIRISGMSCASCAGRIEKAVAAVPGVKSAAVNVAAERVDVVFADSPDPVAAARAIENAGYEVHTEDLERKARELIEMARTLQHLAESCHGDERPDCPIIERLADGEDTEEILLSKTSLR